MKKRLILLLWVCAQCIFTYAQWQLTGNSILSTDFLGSTNAQPLIFKVNNQRSGLIDWGNGPANTAFGYRALLSNSMGSENTAVGYQALFSNTTGYGNTANGYYALFSNTTGYNNLGNGFNALTNNTTGTDNTGIGSHALYMNIDGYYNTATGYASLYNNSSGDNNVANGYQALFSNTTGNNNTASGYQALFSNTNTSGLTAYGYQALFSNTSGEETTSDLTAYGYYALLSNNSGIENTAMGFQALWSNTTGSYNTTTGIEALPANTSGSQNTVVGADALASNTTGSYNTALGNFSLGSNNGNRNTSVGSVTSGFNTTGENNTVAGYLSLNKNTNGMSNTAVGRNSLYYNTAGYSNIGIGVDALVSNTTGVNNTVLGASASGSSSMFNCTLVGYGTGGANAGINIVCIGNTSVTSIKGQVNFSTYSDERFKTNIQPLSHGLDFINRLKPITYTVDINRLNHFVYRAKADTLFADETMRKSIEANSKIIYSGFSAQQVEQAALGLNYNFSGVDKPETPEISPYGLRYSEFIVPLVKAVQELSIQHDSLKSANQELQLQLNVLEQRVTALEAAYEKTLSQSLLITSNGALKQNAPNPFNSNTIIRYYTPLQTGNAQLVITDMNGRNLKTIKIPNNGSGQINIAAGALPAGSYVYSLVIDGKKLTASK